MIEQLWIINGDDPCLWTIPVWAHFDSDESESATLFHAIPLLNRHLDALRLRMDGIGTQERGMWVINRLGLERIGNQIDMAKVTDPSILFTWERPKAHQVAPTKLREKRRDIDDFLDALYQTGLPVSREALGVIYNQICLQALDWIVNKERPLDLYFVKLHNCPYRANWKNVLLTRFPRLGRMLTSAGQIRSEAISGDSGLEDEMRCCDLLAMHKSGEYVQRTIEAEPTPVWHKQTWRVERERLRMLGATRYAKSVMDSVGRWSKSALRVYKGWLNVIARKSAIDVECGYRGRYRLVPNVPRSDMLVVPRPSYPVPVVVPNRPPELKGASDPGAIYPKNGLVPEEVSAVQSSPADLWYRWRFLPRPQKWPKTQPGVLVLSGSKERDPVQLLGPKPGVGPWVANGVKQFPAENPEIETE